MHKNGYTHNDLHSGNILLWHWNTVISDLGLSEKIILKLNKDCELK